MIICREGTPGSGKSYTAVVTDIVPALERGRKVVTNLPLNVAELNKRTRRSCENLVVYLDEHGHTRDGQHVRPFEDVRDFTDHQDWRNPDPEHEEEGPLYVVDEAHEVLGIDIDKKRLKDHIDWLATHRHVGVDVTLITQDHMELQLGARRRLEMRYSYTRTAAQFVGSKTGYHELEYIKLTKKPINSYKKKFQKKNFPLYQSVVAGTSADVKQSVKPVWRQPKVVIFALIILGAFAYGANHDFSDQILATGTGPAEAAQPTSAPQNTTILPNAQTNIPTQVLTARNQTVSTRARTSIDTYEHALQNMRVMISSTFTMNGDTTYYFEGTRNGRRYKWDEKWFTANGYDIAEMGPCEVFIHHPGTSGWVVDCLSPVLVDGDDGTAS